MAVGCSNVLKLVDFPMWQSHVQIEDYSIVFFNLTAVFESHTAKLALRARLICTL